MVLNLAYVWKEIEHAFLYNDIYTSVRSGPLNKLGGHFTVCKSVFAI